MKKDVDNSRRSEWPCSKLLSFPTDCLGGAVKREVRLKTWTGLRHKSETLSVF